MAKSSETFNKKEKEKKRLKKQQDKKERAEERRANGSKGKSLEDMMAYVDADGNITSTPPDPSKRKQVSAEDIQLGVPKQVDLPEETARKGTITMFNESKGFGFIRDAASQESIFVHISSMLEPLRENDKVTFETTQGPKGLTANKVKKA
ncbi:MAG: cold shock domain-containing protein [Bacteroidetes bacterium]|nr:cold shock domain-containing protein [Bacteroidota bacterium]